MPRPVRIPFQYNYSHDNARGFMLFMRSAKNIVVRYNISRNDAEGVSRHGGRGSPALHAGKRIEANGGFDFFGNPVSATDAPNIGAYNGAGVRWHKAP